MRMMCEPCVEISGPADVLDRPRRAGHIKNVERRDVAVSGFHHERRSAGIKRHGFDGNFGFWRGVNRQFDGFLRAVEMLEQRTDFIGTQRQNTLQRRAECFFSRFFLKLVFRFFELKIFAAIEIGLRREYAVGTEKIRCSCIRCIGYRRARNAAGQKRRRTWRWRRAVINFLRRQSRERAVILRVSRHAHSAEQAQK